MSSPKGRVLYIDDNDDDCELVKTILELQGYEATCTTNTAEGLQLAQSGSFDLFLLDYQLPEVDGPEVARQLKAIAPAVPVIFYTANAYPYQVESGMAAGAAAYLTKPCSLEMLLATVEEVIAAGKAQDENSLDQPAIQ